MVTPVIKYWLPPTIIVSLTVFIVFPATCKPLILTWADRIEFPLKPVIFAWSVVNPAVNVKEPLPEKLVPIQPADW